MSAIYKEGYWYPADSLNTLKAVTMSNEDYEALTPQEKEELGGIEIFIPDRPLTGGGTGAVIIYNGVEYAGTPTSRLETLEEIVGDGQQSVGSDLTDAVTQLNSSLPKYYLATAEVNCTSAASNSWGYWGYTTIDLSQVLAGKTLISIVPQLCILKGDPAVIGLMSFTYNASNYQLIPRVNFKNSGIFSVQFEIKYR